MMKKYFGLVVVLVFTILLVSCASEKSENEGVSMDIDLEQVEKITVSTQMTDPKQEIALKKEEWEDLIDKLNALSLEQTTDEMEKGWQYMFKIEQKGDVTTLVSFMEDKVIIDETIYRVKDYNSNDFLDLFE